MAEITIKAGARMGGLLKDGVYNYISMIVFSGPRNEGPTYAVYNLAGTFTSREEATRTAEEKVKTLTVALRLQMDLALGPPSSTNVPTDSIS